MCSDRILQDVTFDRYRCARLVLDCLCNFEDTSMDRMSVAICSILAAKISTAETTTLGSTPKYMRKLLCMVKAKMESSQVDITLKFTLSALWNLTGKLHIRTGPSYAIFSMSTVFFNFMVLLENVA